MLVEIRPLPIEKWHGKSGKEAFSQPHSIEALYDPSTGKLATGLTDEEAETYSKKTGYDLSNIYNQLEPHPFWSSRAAKVDLPNNTLILNTERDMEFIKYKVCKASKFVANSLAEYKAGLYPEATHFIYDEEEEMKVKATKTQRNEKIYALLAKASADKKASIIQIVGETSVRGRSNDFIDGAIGELITEKPQAVLDALQENDKRLYLKATILECLSRNILTKEGLSIYYMGDFIASDIDSAITWFEDPNNSAYKSTILGKLGK